MSAPIEPAWTAAPPPVAGADVAELVGVVPEAPPPVAVVASVVLGDAGCVPEGWAAEPPDAAGALPAGALGWSSARSPGAESLGESRPWPVPRTSHTNSLPRRRQQTTTAGGWC